MVSRQMKAVIKGLLYTRSNDIKKRVGIQRKALEVMAAGTEIPDDVEVTNVKFDEISAIWCKTPEAKNDKVILFLHGGAYIAGSAKVSLYHSVYISRVSNAQLLSINYRLAPEHPYPAALEDAVRVYKWLIEEKEFLAKNIVITGESAGGGLAIALLLKLRDLGIDLPAAAVLISPWADLAFTGETFRARAKLDPFTTPAGLDFSATLYIGDTNVKDPLISPVYADFTICLPYLSMQELPKSYMMMPCA